MAYRDGLRRSWLGNTVFHRHFGPENSGLAYIGVEDRRNAGDVEELPSHKKFQVAWAQLDRQGTLFVVNKPAMFGGT